MTLVLSFLLVLLGHQLLVTLQPLRLVRPLRPVPRYRVDLFAHSDVAITEVQDVSALLGDTRDYGAALQSAGGQHQWKPLREEKTHYMCGNTLATSVTVLLMGGQGGSGTRGVWKFLNMSGACAMVRSSPSSLDSLGLRSAELVSSAVTVFLTHRSLNFTFASLHPSLEDETKRRFCVFEEDLSHDLAAFHIKHGAVALAIKEPVTMYLLPLFHQRIRSMKFLHLTRDVRTISTYHKEGQTHFQRRFYTAAAQQRILAQLESVYPPEHAIWSTAPERKRHLFIKTWADTQAELMRWASQNLEQHEYFHMRVEDIYVQADVAASTAKIKQLFAWLGYPTSDERVALLLKKAQGYADKYIVRPLDTDLQRWVDLAAGSVLRNLGYGLPQ
jgi:hypothetical protein